MSRWTELGEVPDSEDEDGFDSLDFAPDAEPAPIISTSPNYSEAKDIWDVPDSSAPEQLLNPNDKQPVKQDAVVLSQTEPDRLDSSPLSSPASEFDLESVDQLDLVPQAQPEPLSPPDPSPPTDTQPPKPQQEEISTSYVRILSPAPDFGGSGDISSAESQSESRRNTPLQSQILGQDVEEQVARRAAVRYERLLRPRKPIQEHPYLLENAQYSTFLKQHGVKPVRMAIEAERRRRERAEQDNDFEDDSQGSRLLDITDESQLNGLQEFLDGLDNLGIPSPSPAKTSPINDRVGPSSQVSTIDTDDTSLAGEDLPALQELLRKPFRSSVRQPTERQRSPPSTVRRKRKRQDVVDSDPLEPVATFRSVPELVNSPAAQRNLRRSPSSDRTITPPRFRARLSPSPGLEGSHVHQTPRMDAASQPVVVDSDSEAELNDPNDGHLYDSSSSSDTASESGSELVHSVRRRIKGVLPASWLRLDQKTGRGKIQKEGSKRQLARSPEREHRRGVAQVRQATPRASMPQPFFFDDSEDELPAPAPASETTDDVYHNQTKLMLHNDPSVQSLGGSMFDDGASITEDDHIDRMLPGRKRQMKLSESFSSNPKRLKTSTRGLKRISSKSSKQPKISSAFGDSSSTRLPSSVAQKKHRSSTSSAKPKNLRKRASKKELRRVAPQLSLLDVVEPDAPRFLKIAARAVARRSDQGRSSPSTKIIKLATREDHVDAMSVLSNWRAGSIPQRQSVSAAQKARPSRQRPAETLANVFRDRGYQSPSITFSNAPRKLVKHTSNGGSVRYQTGGTTLTPLARKEPRARQQISKATSIGTRPAQLETNEAERAKRAVFHVTKRHLDFLYRKQHQGWSTASTIDLISHNADLQPLASPSPEERLRPLETIERPYDIQPNKSRFRKRFKPQQVDLEAPQYRHANDPLPRKPTSTISTQPTKTETSKLLGLGPYGTQYTHTFEIFPLDARVYFHESTLIGSGAIVQVFGDDLSPRILDIRPRVSFTLGDQILRWGTWNAQTSSELGIVLDFVAEQLSLATHLNGTTSQSVVGAMDFVMKYVGDTLNFDQQGDIKSFLSRAHDVFKGFNQRIEDMLQRDQKEQRPPSISVAQTYDRLLLAARMIHKLCQSDAALISEQFQIEELLKTLAKTAMSSLLSDGLGPIRSAYAELRSLRACERGLRDDAVVLHSWVILMKILNQAKIPRSTFWDILYSAIAVDKVLNSHDANELERLWETMFSFLPLTEFGNAGIVAHGSRHEAIVDGWALPQKMLKKTFQLYQENTHQSPSFNDYCRALVGRCHYLVQQWGWRKCATVVGVIFDFFGSQGLAHLRNEEVFRSPRFLEELAGSPSLEIEPEDRCFHIFLKLIALGIKKLREAELTKDIQNLVARTMPNHDRQYLKEQTIHERDLAALRNHHDLLCTLFWASPPDLRRGANMIERLVIPESSHKEACLINLRAWNQLARFVVSSGEATVSFKAFAQWRSNFFHQTMQQFDSVESDIRQQLQALSKDISNTIGPDVVSRMTKANKAAVMDVLHFSMNASLDVMRHTPDLEAAAFALNSRQLQQIFTHFAASPPELDWAVLRVSLATLATFLSRVDDFKDSEESQQSESQILNSAQADDAIMVVDNEIASSFFTMARRILSVRSSNMDLSTLASLDRANCLEEVVRLSARLGMRFMEGGLLRLSGMFKPGKYRLFEDVPSKLNPYQRKYLALFMQVLLSNGFDDFNNAGFSLCEVWALSIVKPTQYLAYENQLAEQLRKHGQDFVPEALAYLAVKLDYNTNRDLFEFAISHMRRCARDAGPMLKKILVAEHCRTLKAVMEQMRNDLKEMATQDSSKHSAYVVFVRDIISLIKAHGSEFCVIDDFYYQISKEYSPSVQDPQLRLAGMLSYGLRLGEGDTKAPHEIFFLLLNNFKAALNSNQLPEEIEMLRKGMKNRDIFAFLLGKMVPSIIRATFLESTAFPLMDVYGEALQSLLGKSVVPHELTEDDLPHLLTTFKALVGGMQQMRQSSEALHPEQIHFLRRMASMLNDLWPTISILGALQPSTTAWLETVDVLGDISLATEGAETYLQAVIGGGNSIVKADLLFEGLAATTSDLERVDAHITSFTGSIIQDVRKNLVMATDRIFIETPGKGTGMATTQSSQGTERVPWNSRELLEDLHKALRESNEWWSRVFGTPSPRVCDMSVVF